MSKIIVYPNFAGVDIKGDNEFNYPVEKISLKKLIINEKFKDEKHFSSVEKQQQLDKMSKKLDELPPILIIKHPLLKEKYSILDGHHRFQIFKTLKKDMIPAQLIDYKDIFLAKNEYGTKNNKAVRLDKIDGNEINLEKYFNTDINNEKLEEKWSKKYKNSINCNDPKGFSQRAHCQGKKKNMKETEILKGGLADKMSLEDIAKKHKLNINVLKKEFDKGVKVEMEHTDNKKKAEEIAKDHLYEDPKYYSKLNKIETKEMTGADSSGAYVGPMNMVKMKKKDINKINNWNQLQEALDASASGEYDVPFGGGTKGRKDPLKIGGPKTIEKRINKIKGPNFPKWGGPKSKFVKVKDKCKVFPYCNQGDTGAIKIFNEALEKTSEKYGISKNEVMKIVLKTNK